MVSICLSMLCIQDSIFLFQVQWAIKEEKKIYVRGRVPDGKRRWVWLCLGDNCYYCKVLA